MSKNFRRSPEHGVERGLGLPGGVSGGGLRASAPAASSAGTETSACDRVPLGFRIQGIRRLGVRVQGLGSGLRVRGSGLGFKVKGFFGVRV